MKDKIEVYGKCAFMDRDCTSECVATHPNIIHNRGSGSDMNTIVCMRLSDGPTSHFKVIKITNGGYSGE